MTSQLSTTALLPRTLSPAQFQGLADVPPEIEWFANLTNANTRRAYQQDIKDFMSSLPWTPMRGIMYPYSRLSPPKRRGAAYPCGRERGQDTLSAAACP